MNDSNCPFISDFSVLYCICEDLHMSHHSLHSREWWFCISAKNQEGVGFIRKILSIATVVSTALGVVFMAASFFMLRDCHSKLSAFDGRVEDLEYDRLREAYKQAGYEVD